jgi:hypothetical protein
VDVGVAEGVAQIGPIAASLCRYVVGSSKPCVVDDARARLAIASAQSAAGALRLAAEAELKSAPARAASDANAALLNRSVALAQQVFEAPRDQPVSRTRHLVPRQPTFAMLPERDRNQMHRRVQRTIRARVLGGSASRKDARGQEVGAENPALLGAWCAFASVP